MENIFQPSQQNKIIKDTVIKALFNSFPIEHKGRKLIISNVTSDDELNDQDFPLQRELKVSRKTWSYPITGDIELVDSTTGRVINKVNKVKLAMIPKVTNRYTTIIDGNEYQTVNQLRRKSGVYSRIKKNGELESEFNLAKGINFNMQLDPQSQIFSVTPTGRNYKYNLWSILNLLGVPESDMAKHWGQRLLDINKKDSLKTEVSEMTSFYKLISHKDTKDYTEVINGLRDYFAGTQLDPKVTKITLGQGFDTVNGDALLSASTRLLNINKGTEKPDDRDSLIFKKMLSVDDLLLEHFEKTKKLLEFKVKRSLESKDNIRDILPTNFFSRPIREFFTVGDLSSTPPQTNPVTIATDWRKTTPMGAGGIKSSHAITMETRDVQPTHLGFLDPLSTPECVDYNTLILTMSGWKNSGNITKEDLVACNLNGCLEFHKPIDVQEFDYDGPAYIFKNSKIDLFVTKGHRIWSRPLDRRSNLGYRIELAEDVFYKDRLMKMGHYAYTGNNITVIDIDEETYNITDWFSLLGWYISEGNLTKKYGIFISQDKKSNKLNFNSIVELLERLKLDYTIKKDLKGIYIKSKVLGKYFEKFGYCFEKYLPDFVFNAPLVAREALLDCLLAGDGRKSFYRKTGEFQYNKVYTTTSPKLAEDVQRLMASLGFATSIKCYPDNREERYLDVYEVRAFNKDETQVLATKGHNFNTTFKGKVYGITVPGGLIYTKRNNSSPVWTGNSLKVGVNVGLASETRKKGNDIVTPAYNKKGEVVWLNPLEFYESVIGFPDQFTINEGTITPISDIVNVMKSGKTLRYNADKVNYWMRSPKSMFSYATNLVPFLPNVQGNRASTGGRMITQALSIDQKEEPLVQTKRDKDSTYEFYMGSYLSPQLSPSSNESIRTGKVVRITDEYIHVLVDGKEEKIGLYKNFPLNQDGYLDSTPIVKVGDVVKSGQPLAETNYSVPNGTLAIGKNLTVGYLSYKGYNFEDGAVITEGAAKKLTHTMLHRVNDFFSPKIATFDLKKFKAWFPEEITNENAKKLNAEGLPKVGEVFNPGEALIVYLNEKEMDDSDKVLKKLHKFTFNQYNKKIIKWDEEEAGVVTDVRVNGRNVDVYIKSTHPFKEGDKLSGRYGNKYIVTKIIPDALAPTRKDGTPIEVMLNAHGVPSRMNVGQLLETAAGKLSLKRNKPYIVDNFDDPNGDVSKKLLADLTKEGIEPDEILYDGKTGKPFEKPIFVGNQYFLKLRHIVSKKNSAHSYGNYDVDQEPAGKGAQSIGILDTYAYLAHGAKANLREMTEVKGRQNDEYWREISHGMPPSKPERNFVFEKLTTYLKGMGVNVDKNGNALRIFPMTDAELLKLSNGEIQDPGEMLKGKNLTSRKGGLFDDEITGGVKGKNWAHVTLATRIPNPTFEGSIKKLLDLSDKKFQEMMSTGGPEEVIKNLSNIDIDGDIAKYRAALKTAPKTNINKLNSKIKYLEALKDLKISPIDAYTMSMLPIIPPIFRQIYPLPSGDLVVADINKHYKDVGTINKTLKEAIGRDDLPDDKIVKAKLDLYNSVKAMQGFIDPLTYSKEKYKGFLHELGDLKAGLIHGKTWSKRQDLSARSTITVDPTLGLDEVGVPIELAYTMYKPFILSELKETGMRATEALVHYENKTKLANNMLASVVSKRPILLNRAPSLHKHGVQAFKTVLMDGRTIRLNPLIVKGFNADFDGDCYLQYLPILIDLKEFKNGLINNNFNADLNKSLTLAELVSILYSNNISVKTEIPPYSENINENQVGIEMFANILMQLIQNDEERTFKTVHISQIPYLENTKTTTPAGNVEYDVPKGIYTMAYVDGQVKAMPIEKFSVHENLNTVKVKTSSNREVICSVDHSLFCYNPITGEMEKTKPEDSVGLLTPKPRKLNFDKRWEESSDSKEEGYFVGFIVGDGWTNAATTDQKNKVCTAITDIQLRDYFSNIVKTYIEKDAHLSIVNNDHTFEGHDCHSTKVTFSSVYWANYLRDSIGKGAAQKHLPENWLFKSTDFKLGLLSGLIDTDGTITKVKAKTKNIAQYQASYTTISDQLKYDIQLLCADLGVRTSVTTYERNGHNIYSISISMIDLIKIKDGLTINHSTKKENLLEAITTKDDTDLVPVKQSTAQLLQNYAFKNNKSDYAVASKAKKTGTMTREIAKRLYTYLPEEIKKLEEIINFAVIINNEQIFWEKIKEVTPEVTDNTATAWDITVPNSYTFMTANGLIVYDTMSLMTPVGREAVEEAKHMMPSQILFKHGDNALVPGLGAEYAFGLYMLSKIDKVTDKKFDSIEDAKQSGFPWTWQFMIDGKKMTIGQFMINEKLPAALRNYERVLDEKETRAVLEEVGKNYKVSFREIIDNWKNLGSLYAFVRGNTLSITDLVVDRKFRDNIIKKKLPGIDKLETLEERTAARAALTEEIQVAQNKALSGTNNNAYEMLNSGSISKGKSGNVRQILTAPGVLTDTAGVPIDVFFGRGYAEGLDASDYFNTLYGVRKGVVDRSVNTQESGALNKSLVNVNRRLLITEEDCGVTKGLEFEVESRELMGRCALESIPGVVKRNELITGKNILAAKKHNVISIKVRSPLTCAAVEGVCQMCYGTLPDGQIAPIGTNVGVLDSTAITERATQLTMQCTADSFTIDEFGAFSVLSNCYTQKHSPADIMVAIYLEDGGCMLVQNNHPMWVNDKEKLVSDLKIKKDFLQNSFSKIKEKYELTPKNDTISVMAPYFMGCFAGGGCFRYYDNNPDRARTIIITNMRDDLKRKLNILHPGNIYEKDFQVYDTELANKLKEQIRPYAKTKALLIDWSQLSKEWLGAFISGLIDTDGCVDRTGLKIYSTSFALLDQVRIMALLLGIPGTLRLEKRRSHQKTQQFTLKLRDSLGVKLYLSESLKVQKDWKPGKLQMKQFISEDAVLIKNIKVLKIQSDIEMVYDRKTIDTKFITSNYINHNTFHSGGSANTGITAGFPRLEQLLKVPQKLSGKATLSSVDGVVKSIKRNETGGYVVTLNSNGDLQNLVVSPGRNVIVDIGASVKKGDRLSDGIIKPQEFGAFKTHLDAQKYLVDEAAAIYGGNFYKKTFETAIRGISDTAEVEKAPDDSGFLRGDKTSISYLDSLNRKRKKKKLDEIQYKPYFKTIDLSNADVEDWLTNITTNRVKAGLTTGASKGLYANIRGKDPIPAYIYGENFGKGVDYSKGEFY